MNGDAKRSFALVVTSFAVGAVVVAIFGNSKTRAKLAERGKKLLNRAEM